MWELKENVDEKVVKELSEFVSSYIVEQVKKFIDMDYEKAYKQALERAKKNWELSNCPSRAMLEEVFPALRESEDEKIRKDLIYDIERLPMQGVLTHRPTSEYIAYLEKQKENPKNADSIPADCVSNAKCEDRWNKTAISLPDTGRDVLAKDALGNYLLASFDGAQWFVSVYDGEDHPVLHTPPILEWCDIPSETYKESLHISEKCKENADSFTDEDEMIRKWILEKVQGYATSGIPISSEIEMANKAIAWLEEQKDKNCLACDQHLKGYIAGRKATEEEKQKEQKPTPAWMPKFLDELRSKKNYFDWDTHRDIEGHILAIIKWIAPNYFKEKGQKPAIIKPHKGDDGNPYDMGVSEAQEYAINRGFGTPLNDGEVFVDERYITQTIGNILRWADEHPKEQKPAWSEEDENMVWNIISIVGQSKSLQQDAMIDWLKSLRPNKQD